MYLLFIFFMLFKIFIVLSKTNISCLFQGGPKPRHTADKENSILESEERPPTKDAPSKPEEAAPSLEITAAL